MRERKDYRVFTFETTAEAISMEKYCMEHGIRGRLIPIPSRIQAGCGICWRMTEEDYEDLKDRLPEDRQNRSIRIRM